MHVPVAANRGGAQKRRLPAAKRAAPSGSHHRNKKVHGVMNGDIGDVLDDYSLRIHPAHESALPSSSCTPSHGHLMVLEQEFERIHGQQSYY